VQVVTGAEGSTGTCEYQDANRLILLDYREYVLKRFDI
jgi:hypothetical protein